MTPLAPPVHAIIAPAALVTPTSLDRVRGRQSLLEMPGPVRNPARSRGPRRPLDTRAGRPERRTGSLSIQMDER